MRKTGRIHRLAYAWAAATVVLATAVAWLARPFLEPADLVMVYLLAIMIVAMRHGRGPSLLASLLSVAAFDLFFVPPYFTFAVSEMRYVLTFLVMFIVALLISGLTARMGAQAEAARQREQRTAALYAMSRELASTPGVDALLEIASRHIADVFRCEVALLLPDFSRRLAPSPRVPGQFDLDGGELEAAQWAFDHRQVTGLQPDRRAL